MENHLRGVQDGYGSNLSNTLQHSSIQPNRSTTESVDEVGSVDEAEDSFETAGLNCDF